MVDYIEYGGEKRPVSFGVRTLSDFSKKHSLSLGEVYALFIPKDNDGEGNLPIRYDQLLDLAYFGFVNGAKKAGKEVNFSESDVDDWTDKEGLDWMAKIAQAFARQMPQPNGEEEKKIKPVREKN